MTSISKSVVWSGIETFGVQGVSFIVSMIIARLVAPEAYGLIAMINVFISFFQIFVNGGFHSALIQKIDRQNIDYHTAFISNLAVAIGLFIIMYFVAPLIATFYNQPELTSLVRWISLTLVLQSLSLVQRTRLTILYDFKSQAVVSLLSLIAGAFVGILLAHMQYGVWALIWQTLTSQFTSSVAFIIYTRWMPQLKFSKTSFNNLFSFGSKDLLTNIFTSFYININNLVIGKLYTPSALAFYNRGFSTGLLPASLWSNTITRISYPVLCEHQNDRNILLRKYYQFLSIENYVMYPIMFMIILYAHPIITLLLTDVWAPSVPFLQIMCLVFVTFPMNVTMGQVVNALGFPEKNLKSLYWKRACSFICLIISMPFGVKWIAIGVLISTLIEVIIAAYVASRVLNISIFSQFKCIIKPLVSSVIMCTSGCSVYYFFQSNLLQLLIGIPFCIATYLTITYMIKCPERNIINKYINMIKKKTFVDM